MGRRKKIEGAEEKEKEKWIRNRRKIMEVKMTGEGDVNNSIDYFHSTCRTIRCIMTLLIYITFKLNIIIIILLLVCYL